MGISNTPVDLLESIKSKLKIQIELLEIVSEDWGLGEMEQVKFAAKIQLKLHESILLINQIQGI